MILKGCVFSLLGLSPLPFDPASNSKLLQLGSTLDPQASESSAEDGSDPGKKRKRAKVPAGELAELGAGSGEASMYQQECDQVRP